MVEIVQQPQPLEESCVAEVKRPFDTEFTRTTIIRACPQSEPDLSGPKYRHLQAAIPVLIVEGIAAFSDTVVSIDSLPDPP